MDLINAEQAQALAERGDPNDTAEPVFYYRPVKDVLNSEKEGREVFKEVPFVKILLPGVFGEEPDRKVTDEDQHRWPRQWAAFLEGNEAPQTGTIIEACGIISKSWCAALKGQKIKTCEAFINIPDTALTRLGPGSADLQNKVKRWMNTEAHARGLEDETRKLQARIDETKEDVRHAATTIKQLRDEVSDWERKYAEIKASYDEMATAEPDYGTDVSLLQNTLVDKGWPVDQDTTSKEVVEMAIRAMKKATKPDLAALKEAEIATP